MFTWLLQSMYWGTWRVRLSMGSSMTRIKRLIINTVTLVGIGQAAPLIGRALWDVASIWDPTWSPGLARNSPAWRWIQPRQTCLTSCEATCIVWFVWSRVRGDLYLLRQPELCELFRESGVTWQVETYWDQVSLYPGYGVERNNEASMCGNTRVDNRWVDQAIRKIEVRVLQSEAWCYSDRCSLK